MKAKKESSHKGKMANFGHDGKPAKAPGCGHMSKHKKGHHHEK